MKLLIKSFTIPKNTKISEINVPGLVVLFIMIHARLVAQRKTILLVYRHLITLRREHVSRIHNHYFALVPSGQTPKSHSRQLNMHTFDCDFPNFQEGTKI